MIFLIEDEPALRRSIHSFLEAKGFTVQSFGDAETALEAARQAPPDAAVCDVQLPGMSGIELVGELGRLDPGIVRLVMTAHSSVQGAVSAVRAGAFEYLEKPLDLERLARLLERALEEKRLSRELVWHRDRPSDATAAMLGASPALEAVRQQVAALAGLGVEGPPVLLLGETGVGKGLLARAIHHARVGADKPYLEVNCAALPATLVESELFGYEKAAFTGAQQARAGLFEAAAGGTLFLDEVGELPLEAQAKLLKVLENKTVRRLGSVRERPVKVAILAASNVDMARAMQQGTFRKDLFHRLAALKLELPPLRARGDDGVLLARAFLAELAQRYKKALTTLSPEAENAIRHNPWPGNVRELRYAVERAVLLSPPDATELDPSLLPVAEAPQQTTPEARVRAGAHGVTVELPADGVRFDDLERAILQAALAHTGGNVVQAARHVGLSRDAFRYRMRRLGLDEPAG